MKVFICYKSNTYQIVIGVVSGIKNLEKQQKIQNNLNIFEFVAMETIFCD